MNATPNTGRRVAGPSGSPGWRSMLVVGLVAMLLTGAALALQAPAAEQGTVEHEAPVAIGEEVLEVLDSAHTRREAGSDAVEVVGHQV